jgi:hypothetical protein
MRATLGLLSFSLVAVVAQLEAEQRSHAETKAALATAIAELESLR